MCVRPVIHRHEMKRGKEGHESRLFGLKAVGTCEKAKYARGDLRPFGDAEDDA